MAGRPRQGDFLAGGAAAATLLMLVFLLGVTPWAAIPIAISTYVALVLLPKRRTRQDETIDAVRRQHRAYQAAVAEAAAIRVLVPRIGKPAVREQVGNILNRTIRVLVVMREDRNLAALPLFDQQLLEPFHSLLIEYVRLSDRGIRSADGLLEKIETRDLPMVEQAVDAFYEQLHR
ncbi:MAG: hypothetical protein M3Q03_13980, partial [Chloroflexota bacterium]|nr:hypothetical protein [Chloroflexota bacterium]